MILYTVKKQVLFILFFAWGQLALGSHYVALRGMGQPKYKKNFSHFSYANPQAPKGGILNLCTFRKFDTLNPYRDQGVSPPHGDFVFATLMKPARDNIEVAYPYLAESVKTDPHHKFVTFFLRKNAVFHTGEPITAEDVFASFQTLIKSGPLFWKSIGGKISRVERTSPHIIKFVFRDPSRELPYQIGTLPVFTRKGLEKESALGGGSGPYKIASYELGNFIIYEREANWWGENLPCNKGFYNFDTIKIAYYADSRVGFEAFKKGLIDWWKDERISNWYNGYNFRAFHRGDITRVEFKNPLYHGLTGIFINTRQPYLADVKAREALNLLFDFEWLNKTRFFNEYKRNTSIFMSSGYGAPENMRKEEKRVLHEYEQDKLPPQLRERFHKIKKNPPVGRQRFSQALELFKEAGWVLKEGKLISEKTEKQMVLDFVVSVPGHAALFQDFLQNMKKAGIDCSIEVNDWSRYLSRLRKLDFDLILHYHPRVSIPGSEQELFWSSQWAESPSTFNLSGVKNPLVDDLVRKIETAESLATLRIYTSLLDRIIKLGYYFIPGWVPRSIYVAYWRKLNVLQRNASLYNIETWWVRALEKKGV